MKIILCYPPKRNYTGYGQDKRWLPLGIASLGAYIKREYPNMDIVLLDLFDYSIEDAYHEITNHIKNYETNLIGFTCFTEQRFSVWELCKNLKVYEESHIVLGDKTRIKTIVGGPHAFIMDEQICEYNFVDHIVKGEGEKAWELLIDSYQKNLFLESFKIVEAETIKDLDSLPHAIDGFELFSNVPKEIEAEAPIVFSRGCTDYCSFCSTTKFWKSYRSRSASNVFDEMLKYYNKYGTTKFKFHDDASTANEDEWQLLCDKIIKFTYNDDYEGLPWEFEITARADQFDNNLISLLSIAGCKRVAVGIESGNEQLRKAMNKNLDIEIAKHNMKKLMDAGIEVIMLMIVAYPGETDETVEETLKLVREVKPTAANFMPLMVFPGTKVYRDCVKLGWIENSYWLEDKPQPYYTREQTPEKINEWLHKLCNWATPKRILIAAPVHEKEQVFKLYLESLRKLKIPEWYHVDKAFILHNCEHLKQFVDGPNEVAFIYNSQNQYSKDEVTHYWQDGNFRDVVQMKNALIKFALENKYDYIFYVDSDLIVQPDTLDKLIEADKDIASEIFWTQWHPDEPEMPNAWRFDHYMFYEGEIDTFKQPGLYRVGMTGACTLIKRKVLESGVNWNPVNNVSFSKWEDRAFCIRAAVHGFEIWLDTYCPARHLYRESEVEKYLSERRDIIDK